MIKGFFLGSMAMFILLFILGRMMDKYQKKQAEKYIVKLTEDTIKEELKKRKGLMRPINVYNDEEKKMIFLSKNDWGVVSEALMRLSDTKESDTKEIDCKPANNTVN